MKNLKRLRRCLLTGFFGLSLALAGCGDDGDRGPAGPAGNDGAGLASENCVVCHSEDNVAAVDKVHLIKEYSHPDPDVVYDATITAASVDALTGGVVITFNIKDNHGDFVRVGEFRDDGPLSAYDVRFYTAKLDATNNWKQVVYERGTDGTFTPNGDGSYTFTSAAALTAGFTDAEFPARNAPYDATSTYRVGIAFGGHGGPADSPTLDFVPNGAPVTATRNIVSTDTCVKCHGNEFSGHGGDRKTVENCVMCHNPTTNLDDLANNNHSAFDGDPETDSTNMSVMIHNIHNGTDDYWVYRTRAGGNWYNWGDNPEGYPRSTHTMTFPQPSYTCTACHESDEVTMSDGLNWQSEPSIVSCGDSCHTDVDFVTGVGHAGGIAADGTCAGCHPASGGAAGITDKHSTANTDIISAADLALDTPEYTVEVTMLDAAGAEITDPTTDIADTAAQVKIVINDGGVPIDHTTVTGFDHANLFVYGPRSRMNPVLTTAAAAGGTGYYANNDLKTDTKATITADSIVYQLDTATGLTAGTYAAYVDVGNVKGDLATGYQAPSIAKTNFQVGTTTVEAQVAGNCTSCHGDTIMHGDKTSEHRHDTPFDAENCGACHDYTNGNDTATIYEWFGGNPISKRVHAVHAAATLIDPNYTVGYTPAEEGHEWAHIMFPAALNDCAGTCHTPSTSTDAWKANTNQLACMGCHDTVPASEHMFLMGGDPPPAAE